MATMMSANSSLKQSDPQAVMLENVRGLLDSVFDEYRAKIITDLKKLGYVAEWRLLNASDFGVPQLRPRVVFVALKKNAAVTDRHKGATDDRRNGATWSGMKLAFRTVRRMG